MRALIEPELSKVWDAFYANYGFAPSMRGPFPAIDEPEGSVTFEFAPSWEDADIDEFSSATRAALQAVTSPGDEIYYLDWQHECFAFDPHADVRTWFNGFPDGDYAIFLSKDLSFGTFGHPWEGTICFFGAELVRAILSRRPRLFAKIKRTSREIPDDLRIG